MFSVSHLWLLWPEWDKDQSNNLQGGGWMVGLGVGGAVAKEKWVVEPEAVFGVSSIPSKTCC